MVMGLEQSKFRRNLFGVLNYAQIIFSIVAAAFFPSWISGGYLSDCYFNIGDFCMPVWVPVGIATFGSLIGGIWWTIKKYKRTNSWW
jgi:hypothetical protein